MTFGIRPAEAAGLVLIRRAAAAGSGAEVLLGRRSARSRFMPGIYVFPGGRIGPEDCRPSGFAEPLPDPPPGLDQTTRRRLAVFARAALRETYEETGLLIGAAEAASIPRHRGDGAEVWGAEVWGAEVSYLKSGSRVSRMCVNSCRRRYAQRSASRSVSSRI